MKKKVWERITPLSKAGRAWDIDFWQAQKPEQRFRAVTSMVIDSYRIRGKKINADTFRLQRLVENIKQR
ncbi:MAG: hypothetical protein V1662_06600 [Candidatus Omnitrophota bacterium]